MNNLYNLARGKIFTASIGSVDSLYPSVYIYIYNFIRTPPPPPLPRGIFSIQACKCKYKLSCNDATDKTLQCKARFFLLVDLRDIFVRFRVGDEQKSSENDQLTGHFQSFFLISPEKNSKSSKVNLNSVLNL